MRDDELGRTYCSLREIINAYSIFAGKSQGLYAKTYTERGEIIKMNLQKIKI
jgi:hypothetical protein